MRVSFNSPAGPLSKLSNKQVRPAIIEALILALGSKAPDEILHDHSSWYEEQVTAQGIHSARLRVQEHESLIIRVAYYGIKERSIILAYGLYLRDLVLQRYVPLANRMAHHEQGARQFIASNNAEPRPLAVSYPTQNDAQAKAGKTDIDDSPLDEPNHVNAREQQAIVPSENANCEPHERAINSEPVVDAKDKSSNEAFDKPSLVTEEDSDVDDAEGEDNDLSDLKAMAGGLF